MNELNAPPGGNEAQYRELVEAAGEIIFRTDTRGRFTYVNPFALELTGYQASELIGRSYLEIVAPAHRETLAAILKLQIADRTPQCYVEFEAMTASGGSLWIGETVTLLAAGDLIVGFQAVARDISERVQLERLQRAQYEIALLIGTSGTDVERVGREVVRTLCERTDWDHGRLWLADEQRGAFHAGPSWGKEALAIEPSETLSRDLFQQDAAALWLEELGDAHATLRAAGMQSALIFPILLDSNVSGAIVLGSRIPRKRDNAVLHMVTTVGTHLGQFLERCRSERELAIARDEALESSRMKSEFLATVSHEIRTPLHAIIGSSELLLRTGLDPEQRKLGAIVEAAASSLLHIVNEILDFSRIDAGRISIEAAPLDLRELLSAVADAAADRAAEQGLHFSLDVAPDVPPHVLADGNRLRQVLTSLLDNALKFTEQGSIQLTVRAVADERIAFDVIDTGIGLSESDRERLFQPFTQADGSNTRRYGGVGLGLTIALRLAELMGGGMEIESRPGAGSTFRFLARLPRSAAAAAGEPVGEEVPSARRADFRVLVAEDNVVNQAVLTRQLATLGLACDVAPDGSQAFSRFVAARYDLVLMDLQMPVLDGLSATRLIRQWEKEHAVAPVPIIAVTANGTAEDRERCLATGMDEHLPKPLQLEALAGVVRRFLDPRLLSAVSAVPVEEPSPAIDGETIDSLRALADGDAGFLRELVEQFRIDATGQLADLEVAIDRDDSAAIRSIAHTLRGSSANLGAIEVTRACRAIEATDERGYAAAIDDLRRACDRALPLLAQALA